MKEKNAQVNATLKNGFVVLTINVGKYHDVPIKINDFGGTDKKKAKKLAYAIYKEVENNGK